MSENKLQAKTELKNYLNSLSVNVLRACGRKAGVAQATEKKKDVLISEITAVLFGDMQPIERSKKGAPVKNDYIEPSVWAEIERICSIKEVPKKNEPVFAGEDILNGFTLKMRKVKGDTWYIRDERGEQRAQEQLFESTIFKGQYVIVNDVDIMIPLVDEPGEQLLLPEELIREHDLREGDILSCFARAGSRMLIATKILAINNLLAGTFTRSRFDDGVACYPEKRIRFLSERVRSTPSLKYFDWILPVCMGQRACIIAPPKAGKSALLFEMGKAALKSNPDFWVQTVLVDQSPEMVNRYRAITANNSNELLFSTYEDDAEKQVAIAEMSLKRAKRYTEMGRDVLLIVDSLSALARAYNDTEASVGGKTLVGGLESKTVQYIKRFLGTARNIENGGSLTIIGAVSCDTGNPVDDLIASELAGICNLEVRLSGDLAAKRLYPAFDHLNTRTNDNDLSQNSPVDLLLRNKYLPNFGMEKWITHLQNAETKEEFEQALQADLKEI